MKIEFFNTLTRKKEEFKPLAQESVTMYSCGPTVYDFAHIGNLRAYVFADTVKKTLEFNGYLVKNAINITDVGHMTSDEDTGEDKIEKTAREKHKTPEEIARFYEKAFLDDISKLNIGKPTYMPRATEYVKDMISLTERVLDKNCAYISKSGIYFDVSKFPDYTKLARLDMDKMEFGKRIELQEDKKHPADFALWVLNQPKHLMQWDSPWGKGYPGWHIECSAMAMKVLGETIEIQTGGVDHIPVHHTNEIAQSECVTGKKFANFWMHSEFLTVSGEKMAKSAQNFTTLKDIVKKGYDPLAYRYFLLSNHYRSKIDFTWDKLDQAQKTYQNIKKIENKDIDIVREMAVEHEVGNALADDLDIPRALSLLHSAGSRELWEKFDSVLSLGIGDKTVSQEIFDLVKKREDLRKDKKWDEADKVRQEIEKKGYSVKDSKEGSKVVKL